MFKLEFDGGHYKNNINWGYVIYKDDIIIKRNHGTFECAGLSSNYAECTALIYGLIDCVALNIKDLQVYGDSESIINQINKKVKCKSFTIKLCHKTIRQLSGYFDKVEFTWVSRRDNREAHRECHQ